MDDWGWLEAGNVGVSLFDLEEWVNWTSAAEGGRKSNYATPKLWSYTHFISLSLSSALDSVCVACPLSCPVPLSLLSSCCPEGWTHSRCFDFEYEIKFLMGISFGNRHFWFYYVCVLWPSSCWTIWSSANLIWVTHIHCTYAEGDGPCPIHIQSATTILNRVSWWWAILFKWYLILTIVILCPDLTLFNLTWHNKGTHLNLFFIILFTLKYVNHHLSQRNAYCLPHRQCNGSIQFRD